MPRANGYPLILLPSRYHSVLLQLWKQRLLIFPCWQNKDVTYSILSFAPTDPSSKAIFCSRLRRIFKAWWIAYRVELFLVLHEILTDYHYENVLVVVFTRSVHRLLSRLPNCFLDSKEVREETSLSYRCSISYSSNLHIHRVFIHKLIPSWQWDKQEMVATSNLDPSSVFRNILLDLTFWHP